MCGINGILTHSKNVNLVECLSTMSFLQEHRGKDDKGQIFFNEQNEVCTDVSLLAFEPMIALAHQRLSIQDVSKAGHQPMKSADNRYFIVFNGEVYNFKELKKILENESIIFYSNTDTEVVLNSFIFWGEKCLEKFEGMFAFAIWDRKKQELFMARDTFGVKPFYFLLNAPFFAFASELKAFSKLPFFDKKLNSNAVQHYLIDAEVEKNGCCFFQQITELLPAHCAIFKFSDFSIQTKKWYEVKIPHHLEENPLIVKEKVRNLVDESIQKRLISDIPVGACLSGGLDSSIIVATILKYQQKPSTFTAVFDGFSRDESKYAQEFEKEVQWFKTSPSVDDFKRDIQKVVWTQDIPFFSASTFIQYKVMELVAQSGIHVTLDGQGADELFGGYARHYAQAFNQYFKTFNIQQAWELWNEANPSFCSQKQLIKEFFKQYISKSQKQYNQLFSHDLIEQKKVSFHEGSNSLNEFLLKEVTGTTLKNLLRTGDRNSMAHSVEARMPFADNVQLTEYALTIATNLKMNNGVGKSILRDAYSDIVPSKIINRKDKIGFEAPQTVWFKELKPFIREVFPSKNDEFIQWSFFDKNFDTFYDEQISNGKLDLWRIYNFQLWRNQWNID